MILGLMIGASCALAAPAPLQNAGNPFLPMPLLDTFDDTIAYDDNIPWWWYNGQSNFNLATKFTPLAPFELQEFAVAFNSNGDTVQVTLCADDDPLNQPGTVLAGPWFVYIAQTGIWYPFVIDTMSSPAYQFAAGENFWLNVFSPGPPWETFDISPTIPQRSVVKFLGQTTYMNSPGDNFIRAVGEYTGSIVDVACDSIWHNGNFFAQNGSSFAINARVRNANPLMSATFDVGCHIYTEVNDSTYVLFDSLALENVNLGAGASTTVTWPADFTFDTDGRYRIDAIAYYPGDVNLDNNSSSTETQIYTLPPPSVELRYDDTAPDGAAYTSAIGDAWGMMFDPQAGGTYNIASVSISTSAIAGNIEAGIRLLDDNAGMPGIILWETSQVMAAGWNDFNVGVSTAGPVYLMYVFENGANTAALSMDGYPKSGNAWEYDFGTDTYSPAPGSEDWAMRITLDDVEPPPPFVVNLTYVSGSPVPASGGQIFFDIFVQYNGTSAIDYDAWLATEYEGGPPTTLVLRVLQNYQPGWAINRPGTMFPVPGAWAPGDYIHFARVGDEPGTVWQEDSFPWIKSGVSDGSNFQPYPVDGAENPFVTIDKNAASVTHKFALKGAYPNPFNPTTSISFDLAYSAIVKLSVYDIAGRQVATLVDGYRSAGSHDVMFDASNLTSGIYITKLTAGNQIAATKLVLLK